MNWEYIIIHHSLTKDGQVVDTQAIRRYHTEVKGWAGCGYHFLIEKVNNEYEVLVGRTLDRVGAHTLGWNTKGMGICFVGNYDIEEPPKEMIDVSIPLIHWLRMDQTPPIPYIKIVGHNTFASYKTCPGKMFDINKILRKV